MKKQLIALLLCLCLIAGFMPVSADYGLYKYEYIEEVAEFIKEFGYYSSPDDNPLRRALINLLDNDPDAFDLILSYMLQSYDERTMLISSDYLGQLLQTTGYVGVGITMTRTVNEDESETVTVTGLHEQGSAKRAGILLGDTVVSVGEHQLADISFAEVSEILRQGGEAGTFIDLTVEREGARLTFTLERVLLGEPEYSARPLDARTWYMRWSQFRDDSLLEQFHADLETMEAQGAQALIIDLRGNGGGLIDMAFDIVESLIHEADTLYLTITRREGDDLLVDELKTPGGGLKLDEIVILCDGGTASASEIIMAGLCETGYATSVGTRTYGKATAQYEIETPQESVIILTAFRMKTANGLDYDLIGLTPTLVVENETVPRTDPGLRLREIPLSQGNCSDDAQALNQALQLLGLMGRPQKDYRFGEDTQAAVNNFRQQHGIQRADGIDAATAARINTAITGLPALTEEIDRQMEQALAYIAGRLAP